MKTDFIQAVKDKDVLNVRFYLTNELALDPRGVNFHEMLAYAESNLDNLYVADNGIKIEQDLETWDDNFLSRVKTETERNFSRKKLDYYEQVAKQVLKDKAQQMEEADDDFQPSKSDTQKQQTNNWFENNKKLVCSGITIGGAVLTTIGLCVSKEDDIATFAKVAVTSLGIAGLVAGGYMLFKELKK